MAAIGLPAYGVAISRKIDFSIGEPINKAWRVVENNAMIANKYSRREEARSRLLRWPHVLAAIRDRSLRLAPICLPVDDYRAERSSFGGAADRHEESVASHDTCRRYRRRQSAA